MILRAIRRRWHENRLRDHLDNIRALLDRRDEEEKRGRKGKVLAINHDLMSHAAKALDALGQVEELGEGGLPAEEVAQLRQELEHLTQLPSLAEREVRLFTVEEIDRQFSEYKAYSRERPSPNPSGASGGRNEEDESSVASLRDELGAPFQKRLEELDERTAKTLISKLRARSRDGEGELRVEGLTLADRPMPVELQARLLRVIYGMVGEPFNAQMWYQLLIGTWLSYHKRHENGALEFDYERAVEGYRERLASKIGDSAEHETAFANMQGMIFSEITGEPYEFRTPDQWEHE